MENAGKDKKLSRKEKERKKKFWNKVLWAAILVVLVVAGVLFVVNKIKNQPEDMDYRDFVEQVGKDAVSEITWQDGAKTFTFKLKDNEDVTYETQNPKSETFKEDMLLKGIDFTETSASRLVSTLINMASTLIYVALMLVGFKVIFYGQENDISAKIIDDVGIDFSNVAGMEELKEDLLTISKIMQETKEGTIEVRPPKGILLEGSPGQGKTFIAKAFAGETGLNFIALNASDFTSAFAGIGTSKVKKVFSMAKKNAPCVIFIDEIDGIGSKRSSHSDSASKDGNATLNMLLNEMDGFAGNDNIIVIAATNRAKDLDPALLREGRFDRKLTISPPDRLAREAILRMYAKDKEFAPDVDFEKISLETSGMSASAIATLLNEASIEAIKEDKNIIEKKHIDEAMIQLQVKGRTKKNFTRSENETRTVAYHEAGHTVATRLLTTKKINKVSILPTTSGVGGFTNAYEDEDASLMSIADMENEIMVLYAGRGAEYLLNGKDEKKVTNGAGNDIQVATKYLEYLLQNSASTGLLDYSVLGEERKELLEELQKLSISMWEKTVDFLEKNWKFVEELSAMLIDKEVIFSEDIEKAMDKLSLSRTEE